MTRTAKAALATAVGAATWALPGVAYAHGVGLRGELPLPLWAVTYGSVAILVIVYVVLQRTWQRPRLAPTQTRTLPRGVTRIVDLLEWPVRVLGLVLLGVTLAAAMAGSDIPARNPAPFVLHVGVFALIPIVQVLLGDVWSWLNPFSTLALLLDRLDLAAPEDREHVAAWGHWPAVGTMFTYLWFVLAYEDFNDPRAVGVWLALYLALVVLPGARFGGAWVRAADGFGVLFSLLARVAPIHRDDEGGLAVRAPFRGLATIEPVAGTRMLLLVVLGGIAFDGVTRSDLWADSIITDTTGLLATGYRTAGLLVVIGIIAGLYRYAIGDAVAVTGGDRDRLSDRYAAVLVPLIAGFSIAHYFSFVVFEGQRMVALVSDPFDSGTDLFGTARNAIDFTAVSFTTIGWVQVLAILLTHVAAVVVTHDRTVELMPADLRQRGQQGMLVAIVAYAVIGLLLLLGA